MRSKLCLFVSILSLLCTTGLRGQGEEKPKTLRTRFGLSAGVNLANVTNGESSFNFSPEMKTDFAIGAVANFHFGYRNEAAMAGTGMFGIQPELWYSRQGFTLNGEAYNMDYIKLPVMARIYVMESLAIEAGPYVGYMLSVSPASTVIDKAQIKLEDLGGGLDAGIGFGAGFETSMGLTLGARYSLGLMDMANNLKWKNNVISLSVGWLF